MEDPNCRSLCHEIFDLFLDRHIMIYTQESCHLLVIYVTIKHRHKSPLNYHTLTHSAKCKLSRDNCGYQTNLHELPCYSIADPEC